MKRLLLTGLCFLAVGLSACGAGDDADEPGVTATAEPSLPAIPTLQPVNPPATTPTSALVDRLKSDLAGRTGVVAADITVSSLTTMTWPDGCLGLGGPGIVCTQALVPGWLAVLRVPSGREYRYRGAGDRFAIEP